MKDGPRSFAGGGPADSILLIEAYLSVQGESSHAGRPCWFVSTARCNLRCSWCDSEFTFTGGTDGLLRAMRAELAHNGVELYNHVHVDRIVVDERAAKGVLVGGRFLEARCVLSNANVKSTIEKLVGVELFSEGYRAAARAVRLSNSSCQVFLGLAAGQTIPYIGDLVFHSTRPTFDSPALCDFHGESRTFSGDLEMKDRNGYQLDGSFTVRGRLVGFNDPGPSATTPIVVRIKEPVFEP